MAEFIEHRSVLQMISFVVYFALLCSVFYVIYINRYPRRLFYLGIVLLIARLLFYYAVIMTRPSPSELFTTISAIITMADGVYLLFLVLYLIWKP